MHITYGRGGGLKSVLSILLIFCQGRCHSWESSRHTAYSWVSTALQTSPSHIRPSPPSHHPARGHLECLEFHLLLDFRPFPEDQPDPEGSWNTGKQSCILITGSYPKSLRTLERHCNGIRCYIYSCEIGQVEAVLHNVSNENGKAAHNGALALLSLIELRWSHLSGLTLRSSAWSLLVRFIIYFILNKPLQLQTPIQNSRKPQTLTPNYLHEQNSINAVYGSGNIFHKWS